MSRADARSVEQLLIEHHGLGKDGTHLNKINNITDTNPANEPVAREFEWLLGSCEKPAG